MNLLTDLSIKRKIGIGGKEILHVVFSDSRSSEDYGYISTMLSLANPQIIRVEDAYNHDFDINIIVRTEGGAYCQAMIRVYPHNNFKSIDMSIISQESGHLKLKKSKDRLKQTFGHIRNLTTRMHL